MEVWEVVTILERVQSQRIIKLNEKWVFSIFVLNFELLSQFPCSLPSDFVTVAEAISCDIDIICRKNSILRMG